MWLFKPPTILESKVWLMEPNFSCQWNVYAWCDICLHLCSFLRHSICRQSVDTDKIKSVLMKLILSWDLERDSYLAVNERIDFAQGFAVHESETVVSQFASEEVLDVDTSVCLFILLPTHFVNTLKLSQVRLMPDFEAMTILWLMCH